MSSSSDDKNNHSSWFSAASIATQDWKSSARSSKKRKCPAPTEVDTRTTPFVLPEHLFSPSPEEMARWLLDEARHHHNLGVRLCLDAYPAFAHMRFIVGKSSGLSLHAPNPKRKATLFIVAAYYGNTDLCRYLVDRFRVNINASTSGKYSVKALVSDADVFARQRKMQEWDGKKKVDTALTVAIYMDHPATVSYLLGLPGININFDVCDGYSPLAIACTFEQTDIATALLKCDAKCKPRLSCSVLENYVSDHTGDVYWDAIPFVRELLERKFVKGVKTSNLARVAAESMHGEEYLPVLLDHGVPINFTDRSNETPLMHAALRGNEAAVRVLLDKKADYTRRNCLREDVMALARKNARLFPEIPQIIMSRVIYDVVPLPRDLCDLITSFADLK